MTLCRRCVDSFIAMCTRVDTALIVALFLHTKVSHGLHIQFSAPSHLIGLMIGKKGVRVMDAEAHRQENM